MILLSALSDQTRLWAPKSRGVVVRYWVKAIACRTKTQPEITDIFQYTIRQKSMPEL